MKYKVGIVDDHLLVTTGLALTVESFADFSVSFEAQSGRILQQHMTTSADLPDIILIDVSMPVMNGIEVAEWLTAHYPQVKLIALSQDDSEPHIRGMIGAGCLCYLLKDTHPTAFEKALIGVAKDGQYYSDSRINFRRLMQNAEELPVISDTERRFAQLACSDYPYKHVAKVMGLTERTVETIRVGLFNKLGVATRAGMVVELVKRGLVEL